MVKSRRLEFVAKIAGDLVLAVRKKCLEKGDTGIRNMSHVEIVGLCFGAHIGGRACRYLYMMTKTKVKLLLGTTKHYIFGQFSK